MRKAVFLIVLLLGIGAGYTARRRPPRPPMTA